MSKFKKSLEAMKQRSIAAIEKNADARVVDNDLANAGTIGKFPAAASGSPGVSENKSREPGQSSRIRFERGGTTPDVFPDGEVCRLLGKNRQYLIKARKARAKGLDWDVVGHHAGMTAVWIMKECPSADLAKIMPWRVKPGDGVVSVEVLQHTMDFRKLACRRLSDGATVVVSVDDSSRFVDGDQFDAQELSGTYRWNEALNRI